MSLIVKNIIRFILFILVQVYVLSQIPPLHQFITPYLYFLFILWLPFNIPRFALLLVAFILGITLDYFLGTPGLHAAPCVLIAVFVLNICFLKKSISVINISNKLTPVVAVTLPIK